MDEDFGGERDGVGEDGEDVEEIVYGMEMLFVFVEVARRSW